MDGARQGGGVRDGDARRGRHRRLASGAHGPIREAEEIEAARLVGVNSVTFLGYQDGIVEYGLALRRDLAREIRRYQPQALAIVSFDLTWPSGSLNQADHRAVGLATCDAARDAGNRWIFPELLAEGLSRGHHLVAR